MDVEEHPVALVMQGVEDPGVDPCQKALRDVEDLAVAPCQKALRDVEDLAVAPCQGEKTSEEDLVGVGLRDLFVELVHMPVQSSDVVVDEILHQTVVE
jgi:hypothetical protein